jgi:sterol 3beta-glucosyltransferase
MGRSNPLSLASRLLTVSWRHAIRFVQEVPMKILITTIGTRGDIQPFIALSQGLQAAGHSAAICTAEGFRALIEARGVEYAYINNEMLALMQAQEGQAVIEGGGSTVELLRKVRPILRRGLEDEWQAAQQFQPDLLIYHPKSLGSYHIAEKLGIPLILSLPLPFYTPTRAFPHPLFANARLGAWFNRFSYQLMKVANLLYAGITNDFRVKTLGLASKARFADLLVRANGEPVPILYAYSPQVLPVPADFPPHVHVTGYWFLQTEPGWQPPADLLRFLAAGAAPVYIGFGSMGGAQSAQRAAIILHALQLTGQRAVLASGWGGLQANDLPATVFMLDAVPHDWLFPHMAAVVHHGGAGTTAAGLRAGKPTVICPFIADQPFWGRIVHELGVGPQPIPQKQLTAERLAAAIDQAVHDTGMRQRAADLGERIRAEDGVACAVERIEQIARQASAVES